MKALACALVALAGCTMSAAALPGAASPAPQAEAAPAAEAVPEPAAAPGHAVVPGGPMSRDARTCDAAADHCLRPDTWFLVKTDGAMTRLAPVFPADGHWHDWRGGAQVQGGPAYRTRPATFEDLAVGTQIIIYGPMRLPPSESEAYGTWRLATVHALDAEKRTLAIGKAGSPHPVDYARVIVEIRE